MAKLKIAFCIPNMIIGGVESVFIKTLDEMLARGDAEISVFMQTKLREPFYIDWFARHPNVKLTILYPAGHIFEGAQKYMRIFPLSNIRKIAYSLYKKYQNSRVRRHGIFADCDVLIDYKNFSFAKILHNLPQPKIGWFHGSINYFDKNGFARHVPAYDRIVCLSDSFLNDFRAMYPQYTKRIVRIYNPIDTHQIKFLAEQSACGAGKYFCAVSRLDTDKDIRTIIDAFAKFWKWENHPDVNLILVGYGSQAKSLREYAAGLECAGNIIFTGAVPIPFGYMRGAIAHILSSYNEGLGMVLLESAAVGTLNISSDCKNGPAEILMNGRAGLLFAPGDGNALARHMQNVYTGAASCADMVRTAEIGLKRFSTSTVALEISNLILQTIKKGNNAKNINCAAVS